MFVHICQQRLVLNTKHQTGTTDSFTQSIYGFAVSLDIKRN